MSRRRYISTDISTDPKLARLAAHGTLPMLLYTWAIPHMDDWGRMSGDPMEFKLQVCPALPVSIEEVEEALDYVEDAGLWQLYEVDGKECIAIDPERWFRHQTYINKEKRGDDSGSRYPTPPTSEEKNTSPQITANHRRTANNTENQQEIAQKAVSPSPSPSPSISADAHKNGQAENDVEKPLVIVEVYCEFHDTTVNDISPAFRKKQFGIAKSLQENGFTSYDVWACMHWLDGEPWVNGAWDLSLVLAKIGEWEACGRPPPRNVSAVQPKVTDYHEQQDRLIEQLPEVDPLPILQRYRAENPIYRPDEEELP
jgi:hypothetical protein